MSPGQRRRLSNSESQAQYLYEARGESSQALNAYRALTDGNSNANTNASPSRRHNLALLAYLEDAKKETEQAYLIALKELHSHSHSKKDKYEYEYTATTEKELSLHELVLAYNLALHSFFSQEYRDAKEVIDPIFKMISHQNEDFRYIRYGDIKCKVAFLLVDCILAALEVDHDHDRVQGHLDEILDWIEQFVASRADADATHDETTTGSGASASYTKESPTQLKFRLHCYRARYLFLGARSTKSQSQQSHSDHKHKHKQPTFEANTRQARKELKNAMEIYHHQLSGKKGNGNSIGDGTTSLQDSVENGSNANDVYHHGEQQPQQNSISVSNGNGITNDISASSGSGPSDTRLPYEIKRSESQNRHVLFLKANLEFVKGHTTKSLKLCSETQNTTDREKDPNQDQGGIMSGNDADARTDLPSHIEYSVYNNNVAVVHQAAGQLYLAMHYYSHALSHIEMAQKESDCLKDGGIKINSDGTMTNISLVQLLYNAAICAKQAGNYPSAYECMYRFIELSPDSVHHPLPWLHLGQACVGKFVVLACMRSHKYYYLMVYSLDTLLHYDAYPCLPLLH
jgi:hypothetical protein